MRPESIDGFFAQYPKRVKKLLRFLVSHNLEVYLVGGALRDYLDTGSFGTDHDFEIQSRVELTTQEWQEHLARVMKQVEIEFEFTVEKLKFHIYRLSYQDDRVDYDLEFAPARVEVYDEKKQAFGHSDFKTKLCPQIAVEQSWSRRDFSVNAMGVYFNLVGPRSKTEFMDPFGGLEDLKQRILRPIGANFHRDPVRFVRALRFSRKLKMRIGDELDVALGQFNLKLLSPESLKREAIKDGAPVDFLKQFFLLAQDKSVELPASLLDLESAVQKLKALDADSFGPPGLRQALSLLWNPDYDWNESEFLSFALFWGGKKKQALQHFKAYEILVNLPRDFLSLSSRDEVRQHSHFGRFKKLMEFFESTHWPLFKDNLPDSTFYFWPPLLKQVNPETFRSLAQKRIVGDPNEQKGELKMLAMLEYLRSLKD